MMRRRAAVGRRGPGVVGTVARTAVIAGTATVASQAVSNRMDARQQRQMDEQMAESAAMQSQQDVAALQYQVAELQAQQASQAQTAPQPAPAAAAPAPDLMAQMQQLAQLKEAGMLTDEEFQAAKSRLLGL